MNPLIVALLASILGAATAAHAQEAGPAKTADPNAEAATHYREGVAAYEAGKFAEALAAFTEAYNLSAETDLLYNLGACSEKVGDRDKAIAYYQLYLEEKPDAEDAAEVQARLQAIRGPATPAPAPATPAPAPPMAAADSEGTQAVPEGEGKRNPNAGPILVMGLGGLVVVTGALTAGLRHRQGRRRQGRGVGRGYPVRGGRRGGRRRVPLVAAQDAARGERDRGDG